MAASRGLNPEAPDYIPLSYRTAPLNLSIVPVYLPPPPPPPPPPPLFATAAQSPFHTHPLYTTSYSIHPHQSTLLPPPPPPQHTVVEPPPTVLRREEVVTEGVGRRGLRRPKSSGRGGFCGRGGGKREGFRGHHQKEPYLARMPNNFGNGDQNQMHNKKMESRVLLRKHEVLPLTGSEDKTTVMIKNIPKEYNRVLLLEFLDEHCKLENQKNKESVEARDDMVSAFDFMYLPVDFKTGYSRGYAFVNFTEPRAVWKFHKACNKKKWDLFQSPKIREIVCAMIQGKEALVKHFEKSTFWCESDELLPVCFSPARDGSGDLLVQETKIGRRI